MKTLQLATIVVLLFLTSSISYAQDHLSFSALTAEGYGVYASDPLLGHLIPDDPCELINNVRAFYNLASADLAPLSVLPNRKAALKLESGGVGFANFIEELTVTNSYSFSDVEMKFTTINLGDDLQNQDWFKIDDMETRFYYNGNFTFYVDGLPIVTGTMPVFQLEIDYNDNADCNDDVIYSITQYTSVANASAGQPAAIQDIAAAFLADVGTNGIRFTFSQLQPAIVEPDEYVFQSASGKIEIGSEYDDMSSITIDEPTTGICTTPSSTVTSTASGNWLHILNGGNRVVSILDTENMGVVTTEFYVNGGAVRTTTGGLEYMDRNFKITPTTQPANPVKVRLYFTFSEWEEFINSLPTDVDAMSDIMITKFNSSDCDAINNASGEVDLTVLQYGYIPSDESYYLDVEVASFSTFFVHGPKSVTILPVELFSFKGKQTERGVELKWNTASEIDNEGFEIQRSNNGTDWTNIGWVEGKGSTTAEQNYFFLDNQNRSEGLFYYRLKQMDYDGKHEYSSVISLLLKAEQKEIGDFYPNPTRTQKVSLDYFSYNNEIVEIKFYDSLGKMIEVQRHSIMEGTNFLNFDISGLQVGLYLVQIESKQGRYHRKLFVEQ